MMAAILQLLSRDGPTSWPIGSLALPGQTKGIHAAAMAVDEAICLKTRQLSHGDHCEILPAPMSVNGIAIVNASANGTETGSVIETGTAANVSVNGIESANGNAAEMMKEQHAVAVDEENAHENMSGSEAAAVTLSPREKYCDGQAAEAHGTKPAVGSAASETREATRRLAAAMSMKAVSGLRRPWGLRRLRRLHRRPSQAVLKTNDDGAVAVSANASATGIEHGNETTTEMAAAVAVEEVIASVDAPETTEEHMEKVVVVAEEEEEECG